MNKVATAGASLAILLLLFAAVGSPSDEQFNIIISVDGAVVKDDNLRIRLEFGSLVNQGVRIYSEPSHTLLVAMVDPGFEGSEQGQRWVEEYVKADSPGAFAQTALPDAMPQFTIPPRPKEDEYIAVYVRGPVSEFAYDDVLVAEVKVGTGDFGFSTSVKGDYLPSPGMDVSYTHCCTGNGCSICKTCPTPKFSCCITDDCCAIYCSWQDCCA